MNNPLDMPATQKYEQPEESTSLLRYLREKKQMSQTEVAKRASIGRRKLQFIESKQLERLEIREIEDFAKGIGHTLGDLIQLIHMGKKAGLGILKCSMEEPVSVTRLGEGVELVSLVDKHSKDFIGILHLDVNKKMSWKDLPTGHLLFGVALKGHILLDILGIEKPIKERGCFRIHNCTPFELHNTDYVPRVSVLLFSGVYSEI